MTRTLLMARVPGERLTCLLTRAVNEDDVVWPAYGMQLVI
jgi:hypothetical protein